MHGDSPRLGFVLICESVADDGGTQSALRASKARVTGGVLRVGRQLPSASRWVPCGAERKLIGHFPLTVAEQRLCVPKHAAPLLRRSEASRIRRWWVHGPSAARPSGETGRPAAPERRCVIFVSPIRLLSWMDRSHRIGRRASPSVGDATGLVTQKLYADGRGPCYTYTDDGNLATRTWARGVTTSYAYDAWGTLDLATDNPWRFSCEYEYEGIQCVGYNFRIYNTECSQWTTREPIGEIMASNLYSFNENEAMAKTDSLGLLSYVAESGCSPKCDSEVQEIISALVAAKLTATSNVQAILHELIHRSGLFADEIEYDAKNFRKDKAVVKISQILVKGTKLRCKGYGE